MTGYWVPLGSARLARLPAPLRQAVLVRAFACLAALAVVLACRGPVQAAIMYATRCGYARIGPDGGIEVWTGP